MNEHHPLFTSVMDVKSICQPLFKTSFIDWFGHGRFYDDGRCYYVSSDARIIRYLFEKNYPLVAPIPDFITQAKKFNYLVPEQGPYQQVIHDVKIFFNLHAVFDMVERCDGYFDFYSFATSALQLEHVNLYLNSINQLENFLLLFKEKSAPILKRANESSILQPDGMRPMLKGWSKVIEKQEIAFPGYPNVELTARELDCLRHIKQGLSAKESAQKLQISYRTVESYIENIKNKFGLSKKRELLQMVDLI